MSSVMDTTNLPCESNILLSSMVFMSLFMGLSCCFLSYPRLYCLISPAFSFCLSHYRSLVLGYVICLQYRVDGPVFCFPCISDPQRGHKRKSLDNAFGIKYLSVEASQGKGAQIRLYKKGSGSADGLVTRPRRRCVY